MNKKTFNIYLKRNWNLINSCKGNIHEKKLTNKYLKIKSANKYLFKCKYFYVVVVNIGIVF